MAPWILGQTSIIQFYNPEFMRGYGVGVLNGALWTITVELQFYLIVPLLYLILVRSRGLFVTLIGLSIACHIIAHHFLPGEAFVTKLFRVTFLPWVFIFAWGVLVGHAPRLRDWLLQIPFWLLITAFVLSMLFVGEYTTNAANSINPLSAILLTVLVLKLGFSNTATETKLNRFASRTDLSYGMYLYHMPVINYLLFIGWLDPMANVAVTLAISIMLATLSWFCIEKPSLSHKA